MARIDFIALYFGSKLGEFTDPDDLLDFLSDLVEKGQLSEAQANDLWDKFSEPVWRNYLGGENYDYLNDYYSKEDLYDRINELDVSRERKAGIYDYFLPPIEEEADYAEEDSTRRAEAKNKKDLDRINAEIASDKTVRATLRAQQKRWQDKDLALREAKGRAAEAKGRAAKDMPKTSGTARELALAEIGNATTLSTLTNNIQSAFNNRLISETEAANLYNQHQGRLAQQQQEKVGLQQEEVRLQKQEQLKEVLTYVRNNPLVTKADLAMVKGLTGLPVALEYGAQTFNEADVDTIIKQLGELNQMAERRGASEGQRADTLLAMLGRREPVAPMAQRPPIPSELGVAEAALKATGLGEGTKLRNFIASGIAETAEKVRPERLAWWERMTAPPPPEEPTYEDVLGNLTEQANKWQGVAAAAPSSEVAGGVAYGPGGLKAIAERAYAGIQQRIAGLKPEDYGTRTPFARKAEEDPLETALKKKKWWEEYTRIPGVGTVPRLQRAIRFR